MRYIHYACSPLSDLALIVLSEHGYCDDLYLYIHIYAYIHTYKETDCKGSPLSDHALVVFSKHSHCDDFCRILVEIIEGGARNGASHA